MTLTHLSKLLLSLLLASLISSELFADVRISTSQSQVVNLGRWNGSSTLTITYDLCIASVEGRLNRSITPLPYKVQFFQTLGNPVFELRSGRNTLPFSVHYTDLKNSRREQLSPSIFTPLDKTGSLRNCPDGDNGQIEITINKNDLRLATAGHYQAGYRLNVVGGENGSESKNITLIIVANIDDLISISNIENITINSTTTSEGIYEEKDLCIYRNRLGTYQITATGNGADGFSLKNGTDILAYTLTWHDGNSTTNMRSGRPLRNRRNPNIVSSNCDAGANNNAVLSFQISQSEIKNKPAGIYNGILTLMISAE